MPKSQSLLPNIYCLTHCTRKCGRSKTNLIKQYCERNIRKHWETMKAATYSNHGCSNGTEVCGCLLIMKTEKRYYNIKLQPHQKISANKLCRRENCSGLVINIEFVAKTPNSSYPNLWRKLLQNSTKALHQYQTNFPTI